MFYLLHYVAAAAFAVMFKVPKRVLFALGSEACRDQDLKKTFGFE